MMHLTVVHVGVPIGSVDLPEGREWAGGLLSPTAAYEAVAIVLQRATAYAGARAAASLLYFRPGETVQASMLAPAATDALRQVAAMDFELRDEYGRRIAADVVRIADLNDGVGGRVVAHFRSAIADVPSSPRAPARTDQGDNDAGV